VHEEREAAAAALTAADREHEHHQRALNDHLYRTAGATGDGDENRAGAGGGGGGDGGRKDGVRQGLAAEVAALRARLEALEVARRGAQRAAEAAEAEAEAAEARAAGAVPQEEAEGRLVERRRLVQVRRTAKGPLGARLRFGWLLVVARGCWWLLLVASGGYRIKRTLVGQGGGTCIWLPPNRISSCVRNAVRVQA
jgi:hypothetical protein